VLCLQYNRKRKHTQPKHKFILQINQLHVSANDGSHHQVGHKKYEKKMWTAAFLVGDLEHYRRGVTKQTRHKAEHFMCYRTRVLSLAETCNLYL
jgi:hypothetical protein